MPKRWVYHEDTKQMRNYFLNWKIDAGSYLQRRYPPTFVFSKKFLESIVPQYDNQSLNGFLIHLSLLSLNCCVYRKPCFATDDLWVVAGSGDTCNWEWI